jgi:hypothetical protein
MTHLEAIDYSGASLDSRVEALQHKVDDELTRADRRVKTLECALSLALQCLNDTQRPVWRQLTDAKFYLEVALKKKATLT